jgi:protoporphyrinogen oxidase
MSTKTSTKSAAKRPAKKRSKRGAKKFARRGTAIIDRSATLSAYGKNVLRAFSEGVQQAYAKMASAGIEATVVVNGKVVSSVPRREGGRFIVSDSSVKRSSSRQRGQ